MGYFHKLGVVPSRLHSFLQASRTHPKSNFIFSRIFDHLGKSWRLPTTAGDSTHNRSQPICLKKIFPTSNRPDLYSEAMKLTRKTLSHDYVVSQAARAHADPRKRSSNSVKQVRERKEVRDKQKNQLRTKTWTKRFDDNSRQVQISSHRLLSEPHNEQMDCAPSVAGVIYSSIRDIEGNLTPLEKSADLNQCPLSLFGGRQDRHSPGGCRARRVSSLEALQVTFRGSVAFMT